MSEYLGKRGQGYIQQIGYCQRCGWKYLRTELTEDDYIKGLLVCVYCHDPDHPQRYPAAPRAEGQPPMVPAPDQYPAPSPVVLTGVANGTTEVDLQWSFPIDGADVIEQTLIYRQTDSGAFDLIASVAFTYSYDFPNNQVEPYVDGLTYADGDISAGHSYTYYVVTQAVDHRISAPSNRVTLTIANPAITVTSATGIFYVGSFEANGTGYSDGNEEPPQTPYWPIGSISSNVIGSNFLGSIGVSGGLGGTKLFVGIYADPPIVSGPALNFTSVTVGGQTYLASAATVAPFNWGDGNHKLVTWNLVGDSPFADDQQTEVIFSGLT